MSKSFQKIICLSLLLCSFMNIASSHSLLTAPEKSIDKPAAASGIYLDIVNSLIDYINGEIVLTNTDLANNHDLLVLHMPELATDMESVSRSFELLDLFDQTIGGLFTTANTQNGINRAYASDGLNLHRNIILISQGLIDYAYSEEWLQDDDSLLEGKYFQTAHYFPGFVDVAGDPNGVENATVKCSYLLAPGSQPWAEIGNPNVVRPTGCYLAPGSIAEITLPDALIGKGIKIRVGAHFWDLDNKSRYKRLDRVSITYDVNEVVTKIAHPLGGGIYLEIPLGVDEGILDISLKNVVRSPFYSMKTFHETTLAEWQDVERKHSAPWTDFETDKFMMQVPTSWIYEFDDPKTLLENWDKSMDAVSDLLGRPRITDRHKNYLQFDVIIRGSAYHPGYPMSNTPYNPNDDTNGLPNHNILRGPQFGQDIHFHELGHEVAISKFVGETEALVNFLYVPILNKCFDYTLGEAFQESFGPSYNYFSTKDNTTRTRLVADTFHEGDPRNTCSCTKNEVRYQHRGYAHYVDIVELYGWEALERFWHSESEAAAMGNPFPVNNQDQDDRMFRMSLAAGVDLRPLFHFWGLHPNDQEALAQRMEDNNLALPMSIKSKLHQYRDFIPSDYDEFVSFANELYPDFLNYSGDQFDFGAGWYKATAETFDEAKASKIEQALSDIIILYYGTDCFEVDEFLTPEFGVEAQHCKSTEYNLLPTSSVNGVDGSWNQEGIDASVVGQFEYSFVPDLDQCADNTSIVLEIFGSEATIVGDTLKCYERQSNYSTEENFDSYLWTLDGQIISVMESIELEQGGVLKLTATDANGCISEAEITIVETEEIEISITITSPLCFGGNGYAAFEPIGGSGDDYSYSIPIWTPLSAGSNEVEVTDSFGCSKVFPFEIIEPAQLTVDYIDNEIVVYGGTEPYFITETTTGNLLQVLAEDSNGCQSFGEFILTSVAEISFDALRIFPNPAKDELYLDLSGVNLKMESLQLVSIDGQLIKEYEKGDSVLDVSQAENGVYVLQMLFEGGLRVHRKVSILR